MRDDEIAIVSLASSHPSSGHPIEDLRRRDAQHQQPCDGEHGQCQQYDHELDYAGRQHLSYFRDSPLPGVYFLLGDHRDDRRSVLQNHHGGETTERCDGRQLVLRIGRQRCTQPHQDRECHCHGEDHDRDPVQVVGRYTGFKIDLGFFSRLRLVNRDSSFSVLG